MSRQPQMIFIYKESKHLTTKHHMENYESVSDFRRLEIIYGIKTIITLKF